MNGDTDTHVTFSFTHVTLPLAFDTTHTCQESKNISSAPSDASRLENYSALGAKARGGRIRRTSALVSLSRRVAAPGCTFDKLPGARRAAGPSAEVGRRPLHFLLPSSPSSGQKLEDNKASLTSEFFHVDTRHVFFSLYLPS